jgi:carbon monoxide dehydrogenase subunit G
MKLEGEHVFNGPRQEVWDLIRDPEVLSTCLPGTQSLNKISDQEYEGNMNVRIGPVSGTFAGKLVVSNEKPPESCTLTVDGRGAPGFGKGVGNVRFTDNGDGTTLMNYDGDLQVGGTLASVGQRMLDSVSKSMIRQGFEALDSALAARLGTKDGKVVEFKAPTETDFAKGVAKDMAVNLTSSSEVKLILYIVPIVLVVLAFALIVKNCGGG